MSGKQTGQRTVLPSLGRKWDSARGRYVVVLKVSKWDRGTVLMCEAPLAVACGYQRPMASIPPPTISDDGNAQDSNAVQDTNEVEKAQRDAIAVAKESARLKRWLQAMKLKWKPEQILFYEILLYCQEHQPGSKQKRRRANEKVYGPVPPPPAPPPETIDLSIEDKFIKSAQWLFADRKFDSRYDEKKSVRENMLQVLADTALINDTFFSRREKGHGWYPLIGHIRQLPVVSTDINSCVWFHNSVAYLVALTDLKIGDEIVIADNQQQNNNLFKLLPPFPPLSTLASTDVDSTMIDVYQDISATDSAQSHVSWQRLCKAVCEYGKPILDRLYKIHARHTQTLTPSAAQPAPPSAPPMKSDEKKDQGGLETDGYMEFLVSLRESILTTLRIQWLNVEHKKLYGNIPELVRIEFLLIYIQQLIKLIQPLPLPPLPPLPPTPSQSPSATCATLGTVSKVDQKVDQKEEKMEEGTSEKKKMGVPELEDFLESMGVRKELRPAPAIKQADEQLTPDEWLLYQQIVVMANRRLMMYDLLPVLQNDPTALAYQQLWQDPKIKIPGNIPPKLPLIDQWNSIANKLTKKHPSFYDKD
jgi:hypothetical protein